MKQQKRLIESIIAKRKIQTEEIFYFLIAEKAKSRLEELKKQIAKNLFNKDK